MSLIELVTAFSIIFYGNSYHLDKTDNPNENNKISGIELELGEYELGLIGFNNSYNKHSNGITFNWKKKFGNFGLGFGSGILNNYPNESKHMIFISPLVSYRFRNLEVELKCVPTTCSYQFKLKWDF